MPNEPRGFGAPTLISDARAENVGRNRVVLNSSPSLRLGLMPQLSPDPEPWCAGAMLLRACNTELHALQPVTDDDVFSTDATHERDVELLFRKPGPLGMKLKPDKAKSLHSVQSVHPVGQAMDWCTMVRVVLASPALGLLTLWRCSVMGDVQCTCVHVCVVSSHATPHERDRAVLH